MSTNTTLARTLIAQLDEVLGTVRVLWLDTSDPALRAKWRNRLDELLDQRLGLMALRDSA